MKRYDLDALIVRMRALYRQKCGTMLRAMDEFFPADAHWTRPNGGLFIWCDLGHGIDTAKLAPACLARKVVFVPGSTFMTDMDAPCSGLRLNYSTMTDERITEGIRILGEEFSAALRR